MAYVWFVAYMWIGLLLSATAARLGAGGAPVTIVSVGGGAVLGYWQARHRIGRHRQGLTPPPRNFGLALCAWLAAIGVAMVVQRLTA